jgi:hypothetical protein
LDDYEISQTIKITSERLQSKQLTLKETANTIRVDNVTTLVESFANKGQAFAKVSLCSQL